MRTPEDAAWIVRTKLWPPPPRADVIPRRRLLDGLREALCSRRLVLVSAPAGYGKTTLLAALADAFPDVRVAWLSLDEEDNDPTRFLVALVAALQRLEPACGIQAEFLLSRLDGSEARRIVGALVNEVLETMPERFVLVLDDLHVVREPGVHAALDFLLERLPPQMSLAVCARHDPPLSLARLRARRHVAELRLDDLRFTVEEVERFLNGALGMGLSSGYLGVLRTHTEGWPAGLSLLAGSLERIPVPEDRDAFVEQLARTDRHVFEFLTEEVLDAQEPAVQSFLLETSVLTELTPALCAAVTGREDAPEVLEDLRRRNLFVVAVDGAGTVFRYHDLFKEFLSGRLLREMPERFRELHRGAAEAEEVPSRVIRHYLAGRMWDEAARVVEEVGERMLRQGSLGSLRAWIPALPEEVREAHPRLTYLLGRCAWMKWELDDARTLFEHALEGFEAASDEAGQSEALVHLATCLSTMADIEGAREATRKALAFTLPSRHRAQILTQRAWVELARKDWRRTNADLDEALAIAEAARTPGALHAVAVDFNSPFTTLPGGVQRAERLCRLLRLHARDEEASTLRASLHNLESFVHLWRGRWDEAMRAAERALEISEQFGGMLWADLEVGATLPVCLVLRGEDESADRYFEVLFRNLEEPSVAALVEPWAATHLYLLGRSRWLQNRLEEVAEIHDRMRAAENESEWPIAPVARAMMEGLLHLSGRHADAEYSLRRASTLQREARFSTLVGNADLLLAHLYLLRGRPEEALAEFAPVLAENERQGTPGFIMWEGGLMVPLLRLAVERGVHASFAGHVLDLLGEPALSPEAAGILSRREAEVLRLVADGLTDGQVAGELHISPRTVGGHLRSIYNKLGVPGRAGAVRRAVERGLI